MEADQRVVRRTYTQEAIHSFGRVLFYMAEDPTIFKGLVIIYWLFDLVQLLGLPLNMEPHLMWHNNDVMQNVMTIISPLMILPTTPEAAFIDALPTPADTLYYAVVFYLILTWGAFLWAAYCHIQPPISALRAAMAGRTLGTSNSLSNAPSIPSERDRINGSANTSAGTAAALEIVETSEGLLIPYWFLQFIRTISFIGLHALFIPITTTLIAPFYCPLKSTWPLGSIEYQCFQGGHIGFVIASVILIPLWLGWCVILASCIINRVPDLTGKRNILCASHGRVFVGILLIKTILGAVFIFATKINFWAYTLIMFAGGIVYAAAYWQYLPYFHQWLNQAQLSIACIFIITSASLILADSVGDPTNHAGVTSFLVLFIPAIYVGFALGSLRFRSFARHAELLSPFAVELRMRYLLSELIAQLGHAHDAIAVLSQDRRDNALYDSKSTKKISTGGSTALALATEEDDEKVSLVRNKDNELICLNALDAMEQLYKDASSVFASSAILHLFYAHFLGTYRHNAHLERVFLALADSRADQVSLDVRFFINQRRTQIRTLELAGGQKTMTVERRMQFERLQELSRAQVADVRNLVLSFWTELSNKHPDLQRVQNVGTTINIAIADTQDTFKELLELAPQSASVMRAYADFLLELANDPSRAVELLSDAEQIEDEHSKAHSAQSDQDFVFGGLAHDFDLATESLAWCKVSADPSRIGLILDANSAMLKIFGYNRREILGREMSFLVPEPIATIHSRILQRYQSTGQERVVNKSRMLLGLHRNGHIFPMKINIRPSEEQFTAVFEELITSLSFIMFVGEEHGWKVMAACKTTFSALKFDANQMKSGSVSLQNYCPNMSSVLNTLLGSDEVTTITLGNIRAGARVQVAPIPFLSSPVYILRYRVLGFTNTPNKIRSSSKLLDLQNNEQDSGSVNDENGSINNNDDIRSDEAESERGYSDRESETDKVRVVDYRNNNTPAQTKGTTTDRKTPNPTNRNDTITIRNTPTISTQTPQNNAIPMFSIRGGVKNSSTTVSNTSSDNTNNPTTTASLAASLVMPANHPNVTNGDISLCPVVGGNSNANNTESRRSSNGRPPNIPQNTPNKLLPGQPDSVTPVHLNTTDADNLLFEVSASSNSRDEIAQSTVHVSHDPISEPSPYPGTGPNASSASILRNNMNLQRSNRPLRVNFGGNGTDSNTNSANSNINTAASNVVTIDNNHVQPMTMSYVKDANNTQANRIVHASSMHSANTETRVVTSHDDFTKVMTPGELGGSSNSNYNLTNLNHPKNHQHHTSRINTEGSSQPHSSSQKFGRAGSVFTKGTSSTESTITDVLRKGVTARGVKLERSLINLKRSIILVFLVIAVLNAISLAVTSSLFADLKNNLRLVAMNGDRALYMNRAVGDIQSLVLNSEGTMNIPDGIPHVKERLGIWVDHFEELHRELYLSVDGVLAEELELYTEPKVKVLDLIPGTYVDRLNWTAVERYIGLANAGLEMISKIRLVLALKDGNVTMDKSPVWYTMINGIGAVRQAMNQSLMAADLRSKGHVDNIELANLIVMIVAESILALIMVGVMVPSVNSVLYAKQRIFNTFLDVPVSIIRALRSRVQKKLEAIARAENEEDQGIDIENVVVEEMEGSGPENNLASPRDNNHRGGISGNNSESSGDSSLNHALQMYQAKLHNEHGSLGKIEHSDDDYEDEKGCCSCSSKRNCCTRRHRDEVDEIRTHRRRRRRYRNTSSARLALLIGMVWPLLCYVAYFGALYSWRHSVADEVRYIKSEVLWTKQTQFYTGEVNILLHNAFSYCIPEFVEHALNESKAVEDSLEFLQNSLMYGSERTTLRAGIHVSDDIYKLAMVDGCTENNGFFYSYNDCKNTFYNGIFGKGFMQGFREFVHLARELIQEQRTILENDPTLTTNCDPLIGLNSVNMVTVDQMRWRYIAAGFAQFANIRIQEASAMFESFQVANIVITVMTIIALQIFYNSLYKRMIANMDKEIKNVRLLLLLFPDEVSKQVPAIINAGKELLSDAASVSSGSTM